MVPGWSRGGGSPTCRAGAAPEAGGAGTAYRARMKTPEDRSDRIYVQGIHFDLTEAMRLAIADKFRPVMRRTPEVVRLNVRLAQDQKLGGVLHYSGTAQLEIRGPDLIAHAEGTDPYVILDELVEKLDHLVERRQGRRKDKRNHPHDIELEANLPKVTEGSAGSASG